MFILNPPLKCYSLISPNFSISTVLHISPQFGIISALRISFHFGVISAILHISPLLDEPSISLIFLLLILYLHLFHSLSQTNYLMGFLFSLYPYYSHGYIFLLSLTILSPLKTDRFFIFPNLLTQKDKYRKQTNKNIASVA